MDRKLLLTLLLAIGIALFIASVIWRRKQKLRLVLRTLGILTAILPLCTYIAYALIMYIQERPMVGTYHMNDAELGKVELQLFRNNTFEMKADSCAHGFVQGEWDLIWETSGKSLEMVSTSQTMGRAMIVNDSMLQMKHVPVCLSLLPVLEFTRISLETKAVDDAFSY